MEGTPTDEAVEAAPGLQTRLLKLETDYSRGPSGKKVWYVEVKEGEDPDRVLGSIRGILANRILVAAGG